MAFDLSDLQAEIAGEFGSFGGAREFFGDGYGRDQRISRKDALAFVKQLAVFRALKWARENPERRRANANRYAAKPEVRARSLELAKKRRAAKPRQMLVCRECGEQFARPVRGTVPEFCRDACRQRFRYQQRTEGARRIKRHSEAA